MGLGIFAATRCRLVFHFPPKAVQLGSDGILDEVFGATVLPVGCSVIKSFLFWWQRGQQRGITNAPV